MATGVGAKHAAGAADPVLTHAVENDHVPWYKKPNLRYLYFMLFPTCMGIEITSGFDSQMINAYDEFRLSVLHVELTMTVLVVLKSSTHGRNSSATLPGLFRASSVPYTRLERSARCHLFR